MFKVETYENPVKYYNNLNIKDDELHILSFSALTLFLKEKNTNNVINIWTYEDLILALYPNWYSPINDLRMEIILLQILDKFKKNNSALSMKKDIKHLLDAYKYLIEIGIINIEEDNMENINEIVFVKAFNEFYSNKLVKEFSQELKARNSVEEVTFKIKEYGKDKYNFIGQNLNRINKVYIHGMNRLDMRRMTLFNRMDWMDMDIIFRIPYYDGYKSLNEGWYKLYENIANPKKWKRVYQDKEKDYRGKRYIDFLEGKEINLEDDRLENLTYIKFSEPVELKKYLNDYPLKPKEREYFSFCNDELNKYIRDEVRNFNIEDENYNIKGKHIFEYPIGKFLYYLYNCKVEDGKVLLDYPSFVECITSGWVNVTDKNNGYQIYGYDAEVFLKDLEPYMADIESLEDIIHRLNSLKELNEASNIFDEQSLETTGNNRIKKYLSNPLKVFPYVNLSRYYLNIDDLIELTNKFRKMVLEIFNTDEEFFYLRNHFKKINIYWEEIDENIKSIYDGKLRKRLEKALKFPYREDEAGNRELTRELIRLNLGLAAGKGDVYALKSFNQVEGFIVNKTEKLTLLDLSTKSMTKYITMNKALPSYLNFERLEKYIGNIKTPQGVNLKKVMKISKVNDHYIQYFIKYSIFNLLNFHKGEIVLGWVDNLNEYDGELNTLKIIKNIYDPIEDMVYFGDENTVTDEILAKILSLKKPSYTEVNSKNIYKEISPVGWRDLDFCAKKFFYSNILGPNPIYFSDFHQRLAFSAIAVLFSQQAKGIEKVKEYLFPLFPQWTETAKENMLYTSYKRNLKERIEHQNVYFPKHMSDIQLLRSKYVVTKRWKIRHSYNKGVINSKEWSEIFRNEILDEQVQSSPGLHCNMCPHNLVCLKGEFEIDRDR